MKKWLIVAFVLIGAILTAALTQKSDAKVIAQSKRGIKESCLRQGNNTNVIPPDKLEAYCSCSTERVVTNLGPKRLRKLLSATEHTAEDKQIMTEASIACFREVVAPK